jgi:subtilisin family serine protease
MSVRRLLARFPALLIAAALLAGCAGAGGATSSTTAPAAADTTATAAEETARNDGAPDAEANAVPEENEAEENEVEGNEADGDEADGPLAPEAPGDWFTRAATPDSFYGAGVDPAYQELLAGQAPKQTVVVAVIDGGVDTTHEDLDGRIWQNVDETPGNDVDDDGNGYVDDVRGWNFIGGADGENVHYDTFELTRLYVRLRARYEGAATDTLTDAEKDTYARYQRIRDEFEQKRQQAQQRYRNIQSAYDAMQRAKEQVAREVGVTADALTVEQVRSLTPTTRQMGRAKRILMFFYNQEVSLEVLKEQRNYLQTQVEYHYDPGFNPRPIVGDDYRDVSERSYGNSDVVGPDAEHGTIVAGIVGALRDNDVGAEGVAEGVRLMPIRTVPDGDERDKDVANAIRYAVDNGADIINMSFGKGYSPNKAAVDAAVQYADSSGVLMVHAAGNDGANLDTTDTFPSRYYADGGEAQRWITVGASSWEGGTNLVASFSNYGDERVDLFAPGVSIYAPVPDQQYDRADGTSMAAPVVSGVAALIMAYYPELTALQVREAILAGVTTYPDLSVVVPGQQGGPQQDSASLRKAPLDELSVTGGVVNAYQALQKAAAMAGS